MDAPFPAPAVIRPPHRSHGQRYALSAAAARTSAGAVHAPGSALRAGSYFPCPGVRCPGVRSVTSVWASKTMDADGPGCRPPVPGRPATAAAGFECPWVNRERSALQPRAAGRTPTVSQTSIVLPLLPDGWIRNGSQSPASSTGCGGRWPPFVGFVTKHCGHPIRPDPVEFLPYHPVPCSVKHGLDRYGFRGRWIVHRGATGPTQS